VAQKVQLKERTGMANNLALEKQVIAVRALAEGNSIRSVERMTGIHAIPSCA
jgi:hypothetical protein